MSLAEFQTLDPSEVRDLAIEDTVIRINRSAKVVKGGRRFSFSALCVVGNRAGAVGFGYAKAREVPSALEKAIHDAKKRMIRTPIVGTTVPHETWGEFGASAVKIIPAAPGTGIIAGATVRAVLELAGYRDVLTKAYGSTNPVNTVQATFLALGLLRTRENTEKLRGVAIG